MAIAWEIVVCRLSFDVSHLLFSTFESLYQCFNKIFDTLLIIFSVTLKNECIEPRNHASHINVRGARHITARTSASAVLLF